MEYRMTLNSVIKDLIAEVESVNFTNNFKERFVDSIIRANQIPDLDAFELRFERKAPSGTLYSSDMTIGKAECSYANPLERILTEEEEEYLRKRLPKYLKYLGSTEEWVVFTTNKWKDYCVHLVPIPGYTGPKLSLPSKVVWEAPNGYRVLELEDVNQLVTEGRAMQHCIGNRSTGYREKVGNNCDKFFSIRSSDNESCLTVHMIKDKISSVKGERNRLPGCGCGTNEITKSDEVEAILGWVRSIGVDPKQVNDLNHLV